MISFIVIANRTDFYGIAQLLTAVPMSYIVCNVAQKAIYSKTDLNIKEDAAKWHLL